MGTTYYGAPLTPGTTHDGHHLLWCSHDAWHHSRWAPLSTVPQLTPLGRPVGGSGCTVSLLGGRGSLLGRRAVEAGSGGAGADLVGSGLAGWSLAESSFVKVGWEEGWAGGWAVFVGCARGGAAGGGEDEMCDADRRARGDRISISGCEIGMGGVRWEG